MSEFKTDNNKTSQCSYLEMPSIAYKQQELTNCRSRGQRNSSLDPQDGEELKKGLRTEKGVNSREFPGSTSQGWKFVARRWAADSQRAGMETPRRQSGGGGSSSVAGGQRAGDAQPRGDVTRSMHGRARVVQVRVSRTGICPFVIGLVRIPKAVPTCLIIAKIIKIWILPGYVSMSYRTRICIRNVSDTWYASSCKYPCNIASRCLTRASRLGPDGFGLLLQHHGPDTACRSRLDRRLGYHLPHYSRPWYTLLCSPSFLSPFVHHGRKGFMSSCHVRGCRRRSWFFSSPWCSCCTLYGSQPPFYLLIYSWQFLFYWIWLFWSYCEGFGFSASSSPMWQHGAPLHPSVSCIGLEA